MHDCCRSRKGFGLERRHGINDTTTILDKRNWLMHNYIRERAEEFMSDTGRQRMLKEIEECRELFQAADAPWIPLFAHCERHKESPTSGLNRK